MQVVTFTCVADQPGKGPKPNVHFFNGLKRRLEMLKGDPKMLLRLMRMLEQNEASWIQKRKKNKM